MRRTGTLRVQVWTVVVEVDEVPAGWALRIVVGQPSVWVRAARSIAFTSDLDGNREIYSLRLADGTVQRPTESASLDGIPAWRP